MQNNNNFCILNKNPSLPSMFSMPSMPYTSSRLSIQSTRPIIERYDVSCDKRALDKVPPSQYIFCPGGGDPGYNIGKTGDVDWNQCFDKDGNPAGQAECGNE